MASLVATPAILPDHSNPYAPYNSQPKGSILRNARHEASRSSSLLSPSFPRTDSISSSDNGSQSRSGSPARKIRFAPLPDPRRSVMVTETGEILPCVDTPTQLQGAFPELPAISPDTPYTTASGAQSNASIGDETTETGSEFGSASSTIATSKKKKWSKRLLGPLLKTSTASKGGEDPSSSIWRTTSRDSLQSNASSELGTTSSRRMSTSSFDNRGRSSVGVPLTLVQSEGAPSSRSRTRMLNGRVYGAPRPPLPGSSLPTVEEPAFVEWGYGGAGSVNNSTNSNYSSLQSSKKLSVGAEAAADDDDGSGMAWVKKRRLAREQAQREKEEQEAKEKAEAEKLKQEEPTVDLPVNVETEDVDTRPTTPTPSTVQTAAEHMSRGVESSNSAVLDPSLEHHVVKAVNIPGPVHRPHHHLHHPSAGSLKEIMSSIENEAPATIVNQSEMSPDRSSSTSDTSDDEDDEDEDEDHEREEESDTEADDEEELDKTDPRKTSICAGVEKVSRHKELQN